MRSWRTRGYYRLAIEVSCRYFKPARYDDLLTIRTEVSEFKGVRLGFKYEILRDGEKLAERLDPPCIRGQKRKTG